MSEPKGDTAAVREPVLSPVDRVSELLFGLFMALTFVGAVSVANVRTRNRSGRCLPQRWAATSPGASSTPSCTWCARSRIVAGRSRSSAPSARLRTRQPGAGSSNSSLSRGGASLVSEAEIEAIRGRIVARSSLPARPSLHWTDLLAAVGIFLIVTASTFPVVLPFLLIHDVAVAKAISRAVALAMLFCGGLALGRFAGYGSWKAGLLMAGLGTALVAAIKALGG